MPGRDLRKSKEINMSLKTKGDRTGAVLDFKRGRIMTPIPGTVCYERGQAVGIWGKDVPVRLMWWPDGQAEPRPMTRAEDRFARRVLGIMI